MINTEFHTKVEQFDQQVSEFIKAQPKSAFTKFFYRIFHKIETDQEIVRVLTSCAKEILISMPDNCRDYKTLQSNLRNSEWTPSQDIDKEDLSKFCYDCSLLFEKIIPNLEKSPFSKESKMPKEVQDFLSKDVRELREEKKAAGADPEHRAKRKFAKGKLAAELGHSEQAAKGQTGTMIIKDINGKNVAIHKVDIRDTSFYTRFKSLLKMHLGGQSSYLSTRRLAQPMSEVASYIICKTLGLDLVSVSKPEEFKTKKGVMQVFITRKKGQGVVQDVKVTQQKIAVQKAQAKPFELVDPDRDETAYMEFNTVKEAWNSKESFTEAEIALFQQFALFDYLIGNLDRHEENWFVTMNKMERSRILKRLTMPMPFLEKKLKSDRTRPATNTSVRN